MRGYITSLVFFVVLLNVTQLFASESGRAIYHEYCHICHGTGIPDIPQFGDVEHWKLRTEKGVDALYNAALYGLNAMPPMGLCDECSEEQVKAAVDYMVSSSH